MYINYSGSQIIYGELILYLAEQYLLLHKDHRFRSGGVLFFIFILLLFCWSVVRFQQPLPCFSCVVCIQAVDGFRALL